MNILRYRHLFLIAVMAILAIANTGIAQAAQPNITRIPVDETAAYGCDGFNFTISETYTGQFTRTEFFDQAGNTTRIQWKTDLNLTFTNDANGNVVHARAHRVENIDPDALELRVAGLGLQLYTPSGSTLIQDNGMFIIDLVTWETLFEAGANPLWDSDVLGELCPLLAE